MDARHFDSLARSVSTASPRRSLLALLTSLPLLGGLLGGLLALRDPDDMAARKNRRKGRKKPHKRASRRRKKAKQRKGKDKKQKCQAHSKAKTCANRCGTVKNNCKKNVDCGSCVCDPTCDICKTCNDRTGVCEPDPQQQGDACGAPGQVCQSDGQCACDTSSCAQGQHCQGEVCVCDGSSCDGCCDEAGACQPGTAHGACGRDGAACLPCSGSDTCGGGGHAGGLRLHPHQLCRPGQGLRPAQ